MGGSKAAIFAGIGLAVLGLAGCGTTDAGDSTDSTNFEQMDSGSVSKDPAGFDQKGSEQYLTQNSSISLQGSDVTELIDKVLLITAEFSGVVSQQDIRNESEQSYASLTIDVPESDLEDYLDHLASVGEVTFLSTSTLDVTTTVIDLDTRVDTLNTSISALTTLQGAATSVTDLIAVESELTARIAERDSLVAQRGFLQSQIDMSTVYVSIWTDPSISTDSPQFVQGIQNGWNSLINAVAASITFAGFLVPFLAAIIVLIILIAAILKVIKRVRQRI